MFDIFLGPQPEKFLKKVEKELRQRIWKKLDELKQNPFPSDVVRVVGRKEKAFRVRVGVCRIQYYVFQDKKQIAIFDIDKRERAYN
ncbi:MAG: type II toxin-antitoxin system RelE/ParE family toxin [Nanoarchaeota archaeon]